MQKSIEGEGLPATISRLDDQTHDEAISNYDTSAARGHEFANDSSSVPPPRNQRIGILTTRRRQNIENKRRQYFLEC